MEENQKLKNYINSEEIPEEQKGTDENDESIGEQPTEKPDENTDIKEGEIPEESKEPALATSRG